MMSMVMMLLMTTLKMKNNMKICRQRMYTSIFICTYASICALSNMHISIYIYIYVEVCMYSVS